MRKKGQDISNGHEVKNKGSTVCQLRGARIQPNPKNMPFCTEQNTWPLVLDVVSLIMIAIHSILEPTRVTRIS